MSQVQELARRWAAARRAVVLTGAGISTDSGIPDFRGPNGLWTRMPGAEAMFDIDVYVSDPEVRRRAWANRRHHGAWIAQPNRGHLALADLQRAGHLGSILTQNIDGLHQRAGSLDVLELHGTIWEVACLSCAARWPTAEVLAREEEDPPCPLCGGILKSATVSFGQPLDATVLRAAVQAVADSDLLIAIGTSLRVNPVAGMAGLAEQLAIINAEPTPYDEEADVIVREPISDVLDEVRALLG
jgi:NAD-dependent deacetylase